MKGPQPTYDPEYLRDVSVAVYKPRRFDRAREEKSGGPAVFGKDAASYDSLTRAYLDAINDLGLQGREIHEP